MLCWRRAVTFSETRGVATQVAFNQRYAPLVRGLKRMLTDGFSPSNIHHVRYGFIRMGRTDVDFSKATIHGID